MTRDIQRKKCEISQKPQVEDVSSSSKALLVQLQEQSKSPAAAAEVAAEKIPIFKLQSPGQDPNVTVTSESSHNTSCSSDSALDTLRESDQDDDTSHAEGVEPTGTQLPTLAQTNGVTKLDFSKIRALDDFAVSQALAVAEGDSEMDTSIETTDLEMERLEEEDLSDNSSQYLMELLKSSNSRVLDCQRAVVAEPTNPKPLRVPVVRIQIAKSECAFRCLVSRSSSVLMSLSWRLNREFCRPSIRGHCHDPVPVHHLRGDLRQFGRRKLGPPLLER